MRVKYTFLAAIISCFGFLVSCKSTQPFIDALEQTTRAQLVPSQKESLTAVKQALNNGIARAVKQLGRDGGFSRSVYKLRLPKDLAKVAQKARSVGLDKPVDDFEASLNRAAEKALPVALDLFQNTLAQMSIADVVKILQGNDTAATNYFKKQTQVELKRRFLPIVSRATDQVGVTRNYKKLSDKLRPFQGVLGVQMPSPKRLDDYVTQQATQALFAKIADEERLIRQNPAKRTSELMRKVFSYYQ